MVQCNTNVGYKENFCEMNILFFIAFFKIQRFISLKTELKTLAAYHSGHGWNSTNHFCLEWLFSLEQEFSTSAVHRITFKIGEHLKAIDGPRPIKSRTLGMGWGGIGLIAQYFLFPR